MRVRARVRVRVRVRARARARVRVRVRVRVRGFGAGERLHLNSCVCLLVPPHPPMFGPRDDAHARPPLLIHSAWVDRHAHTCGRVRGEGCADACMSTP